MSFIDIRNDANDPLLINERVSLIVETDDHNPRLPGSKMLQIHYTNGGEFGGINGTDWRISADGIAQAVKTQGQDLMELPFNWGDRRERMLIDPAALSYVTISEAQQSPDEAEPVVAFIMGMKGGAHIESTRVPARLMTAFMTAAEAINPRLQTIPYAVGRSRFYEVKNPVNDPAYKVARATHDPADIIQIYANSSQVNVKYSSGNELDFNVTTERRDYSTLQLNRLFKRIARMRGDTRAVRDALFTDTAMMDRICAHADRYSERMKNKAVMDFARAVAKDCPQLRTLPGVIKPFYVRGDNITYVVQSENSLYFSYDRESPLGRNMSGGSRAMYKDVAAAKAALKDLPRLMP